MRQSNITFTNTEVVYLCDKSPREISRDIRSGLLPVTRKGRAFSVSLDDLKHYLKIDEKAEAMASQQLPLLDLLRDLPKDSESRVFLAQVAQVLQKGLENYRFADSSIKAVNLAISILSGADRYLGDRVEVVGWNEDWGTFRILAGTRAFGLLVTGRNQGLRNAWPGPAVCFKGFEFDEINPRSFEALGLLIEGVINANDTHVLHAHAWTSPATRADRLRKFLEHRDS